MRPPTWTLTIKPTCPPPWTAFAEPSTCLSDVGYPPRSSGPRPCETDHLAAPSPRAIVAHEGEAGHGSDRGRRCVAPSLARECADGHGVSSAHLRQPGRSILAAHGDLSRRCTPRRSVAWHVGTRYVHGHRAPLATPRGPHRLHDGRRRRGRRARMAGVQPLPPPPKAVYGPSDHDLARRHAARR